LLALIEHLLTAPVPGGQRLLVIVVQAIEKAASKTVHAKFLQAGSGRNRHYPNLTISNFAFAQ
jgi:hypothetical protein